MILTNGDKICGSSHDNKNLFIFGRQFIGKNICLHFSYPVSNYYKPNTTLDKGMYICRNGKILSEKYVKSDNLNVLSANIKVFRCPVLFEFYFIIINALVSFNISFLQQTLAICYLITFSFSCLFSKNEKNDIVFIAALNEKFLDK